MPDNFNVQIGVVYDKQQAKNELERQIKSLQQNSKLALKMEISDKEAEQAIKSQTKAWSQYRKEAVQAITAPNVELKKMKQMYKDQESDIQKNIKAQKQLYIAQEEATKINEQMNQSRIKSSQISEQTSKSFEKLNYRIQAFTKDNPKAVSKMGNEFETLRQKVLNASKSADPSEYKKLNAEFSTMTTKAKAFGNSGQTIFSRLNQNLKQFASYMTSATIAMTALRTATAAVDTVKELDTAIVDLQMATGDTNSQAKALLGTYIDMGKQLGATGMEVAASATDYLKQGKTLAETNELIKDSMVLSKIGSLSSADATKYLTSAMKGYKVATEDVMGIVDKLSSVDLVSATDVAGLAEGMSQVSNTANIAGVSMSKLLSYLATVGEVTQKDMSSIGQSFQTMFSRMGNVKLGKLIDNESGESLNDVEGILGTLGIKLRDSKDSFRDFGDVLDDIGKKWSTYTDVQKNSLGVAIAGTRQRENFSTLMENYAKSLEYATVAEESNGTAMQKFSAYEESITAKTKRLQASFEELVQDTLNSSLVKGFYDGANAVVNFADSVGLLNIAIGSLVGIGIASKLGIFSQIKDLIGISTKKDILGDISSSMEAMAVSTKVQTVALAENITVKEAEAVVNAELAASEGVVTASTVGFTASIEAMTASIITFLTTNPLGWALLAGTAIMGVTKIVDAFTVTLEEQKEKSEELSSEYNSLQSQIKNTNTELDTTHARIKELEGKTSLSFVEQDELDKLKQTNSELSTQIRLLQTQADEKQKAVAESVKEEFKKDVLSENEKTYQIGSVSDILKSNESGMNVGTSKTVETTEEDYAKNMISLIEEYNKKKKEGLEISSEEQDYYNSARSSLSDIGVKYADYASRYGIDDDTKKSWTDFAELIDKTLNPKQYKESIFDQIYNKKDFSSYKKQLESLSASGKLSPDVISSNQEYKRLISETGLTAEEVASNINSLNQTTKDTSTSVGTLSDSITSLAGISDKMDALDSAFLKIKEGSKIDLSDLSSLQKQFGDVSGFDDFIKTLTSSKSTTQDIEKAFSKLTNTYIKTSGILDTITDQNKDLVISQLKQLGISNAEILVKEQLEKTTGALALQKIYEADGTKKLSDMTAEELVQFENEQGASEITRQALANLAFQKFDLASITLDESSNIRQLIALANAAGKSAYEVSQAQDILDQVNSGTAVSLNSFQHAQSIVSSVESGTYKWQDLNPDDFTQAVYSGGQKTQDYESKAESTSKSYDMIARAIKRVSDTISNLGKIVSNTYRSWSERNSALSSEMGAIYEQISNQQQAYQAYMNLANNLGLDEGIASMIRNGTMGEFNTSDEALQAQIDSYISYYDSATEAANAVEDLRQQLGELAKTNFDNVSSQYETRLQQITHLSKMINGEIDLAEKRGYMVSAAYYQSLISIQTDNISKLTEESNALKVALQQGLNSGAITMYSEAWASMDNQISSVSESIQDATSSLQEYITAMRKVEWDKFDYIRESVSGITSEAEFLINLLDNKSTTGKTGLTSEGNAVVGLHAVSYNTYMNQADEYRKAVIELNAELAKDPYNKTLIERRDALLKLQQESITSAEDEKSAITDLIKSGYESEKSALQELIDKKKKYNETINDEYDYQKTLTEQTKAISEYQKQLEAYKNDISEDTKSKVQTITVSLKEAQETLAETERQKAISDQEKLLDNLMSDADALFNARMDNIDGLIDSVIQQTNANSEQINTTIGEATSAVGYTLTDAMTNIWKGDGGVTSVISKYGEGFLNSQTSLQSTINGIKAGIDGMVQALNAQAQAAIAATQAQAISVAPAPSVSPVSEPASSGGGGGSGNFFISSPDYYSKSNLNTETSIVDRLKYHDFASDFNSRAYYYEQMGLGSVGDYYGGYDQNINMISTMRNMGYKNGTKSTGINETNWVHENELVIRPNDNAFLTPLNGASVFNKSQTDFLWDLSKNQSNLLDNATATTSGTGSNIFAIDVDSINMTGVNDPQRFANALLSTLSENAMVKRAVSEVAVGVGLGNNSLKVNSFR